MTDTIERQHITNAMNWIEDEQEEKNMQSMISKLKKETMEFRLQAEKKKCIAICEMYGAISRTCSDHVSSYGKKLCHLSLAMVHMCAKLNYIDSNTERNLMDYLDARIQYFNQNEQNNETD